MLTDHEPDEELEAKGYIYTHWDCPACESVNEDEGDCKAETLVCQDCGKNVRIL